MRRLRQMNSDFQTFRKKLKSQRGFTLVELMAVLIITGLILAMAVPKVVGIIQGSEEDVHHASLDSIERAAEMAFLRGVPSESDDEILYSVPTLVAGGFLDVTEGTGLEDEFVVLGDIDGSSIIPPGHIGGGNGNGNGGGNGNGNGGGNGGGNGENGNNGGNGGSGGNNSGNGGNGSGSNNGGSGNGSGGNVGDNNGTGEVPDRDPIPPNPVSDFEYTSTTTQVTITGHKSGLTEIRVPRTIDGKKVTSVSDTAFTGNEWERKHKATPSLKGTRQQYASIELPDTMRNIRYRSWSGSGSMNVTKYEGAAFMGTTVRDLYLGEGLTSIGDKAFFYANLEHVNIPDSVTSLGRNAFENSKLQSVNIGAGVSTISVEAFHNNHLTTLYIPKNIKTIGNNAFSKNALEKVVIEDKDNLKVSPSAFEDNPYIKFYDINGKELFLGDLL